MKFQMIWQAILSKMWCAVGRSALVAVIWAAPATAADAPRPPSPEEAPIAFMLDVNSGQILFQREPNRRFIPASIVKTMTVYVAFEMVDEGRIGLADRVAINPETFAQWSRVGSTMFIPHNAMPTIEELIRGVTTISANDASIYLAEYASGSVANWTKAMNATARELDMGNSHFGTPNGWMDGGKTFTTAADLAVLGKALVTRHPEKYARYFGQPNLTYNGITQRNYDPITGAVAGADGIKTGFTNQAGHGFLGSAERDGRRLVMVVAGTDSNSERARISRSFMEWGFGEFAAVVLFEPTERVGVARVQGGGQRLVGLVSNQAVKLSLPQKQVSDAQVSLAIRYNGPIRAPIAAGEQVAELAVFVDGREASSVPLFAQHDVVRANPLQRVVNGVLGWFS